MIKKYQDDYYNAISRCNEAGNSNEFIEFMLKMIDETVSELLMSTTQEQLAQKLGITRDGVSHNIKKLRAQGKIERIGSTKSGTWLVK